MSIRPTISVVMPTYNCRDLLAAHLPSMQAWAGLALEIIVVDSRSTDGTLDLIRAELKHPRLRINERDRGLYASWNEGIAATTGDWVYISTAGDTIAHTQLLHLCELGERLSADVVVSPPDFVHENGRAHRDLGWPPARLLQAFGKGRPFLVNPEATQFLAFQNCPQAILGSSASNLYRGAHLRARPFPTEYGVVGDTAWIMRYGHETRLALTPRRGSTFCIHEKESTMTHEMFMELHLRLLANETDRLGEGQQVSPMLAQALAHQEIRKQTKALQAKKRLLWRTKENRLVNKARWLTTTADYLWCRMQTKLQAQKSLQAMRAMPGLFTHLDD